MRRGQAEWVRNHPLFAKELREGRAWERAAADLVARSTLLPVVIDTAPDVNPDTHVQKSRPEQVDLLVGERTRLEVKSRRVYFTGDPRSYPYRTAFVYTASTWDRKHPKPHAIILVSRATSECLVVPGSSRPHWERRLVSDRVRQMDYWAYEVERGYLRSFDSLMDWIKWRET